MPSKFSFLGEDYKLTDFEALFNTEPGTFKIYKSENFRGYLIIEIQFCDSSGDKEQKVMVFKCTWEELEQQGFINSGVSDTESHISPVAVFPPTKEGWDHAYAFIKIL